MRLIAVLLFASGLCFAGTIWGDPTVDYPPTSSTDYILNSLGNAVYALTDNQALAQVSIAGRMYLEVESADVDRGPPALPIEPVIPPPAPIPPPPPVPPVSTPEPGTSVYLVGAIAVMVGMRLLVR